jgi:hypothetical protein
MWLVTDEVRHTGKHCDFVNVVKLAVAFPVERRPQIRNEDLCALEKPHFLPLKRALISEAWKLLRE